MGLADDALIRVERLFSREALLPSGARVHYATAGEDGPAIVLLHGGGPGSSGIAAWYALAPFLASRGFRVYCPDMPGFGLTRVPSHANLVGRAGHLRLLDEFVDALCLDRFHVVGTWTGADTAAGYICAHVDRIISFALIAGPVGDILDQQEIRSLDRRPVGERVQLPRFDGTPESMRAVMTAIAHDPASVRDDIAAMRAAAAKLQAALFAQHQAQLSDTDPNAAASLSIKGRFDAMTIPGICVWGNNDALAPIDAGVALEERLRNVQFFFPEGVGHQAQNDRLDIFGELLAEFFRDGVVSPPTADVAGISRHRTGPRD